MPHISDEVFVLKGNNLEPMPARKMRKEWSVRPLRDKGIDVFRNYKEWAIIEYVKLTAYRPRSICFQEGGTI